MTYENPGNRVYSFDAFTKEASLAIGSTHELSYQDLKILLKYLARDKKSVVYDDVVNSLPGSRLDEAYVKIVEDCQIQGPRTKRHLHHQ